MSGNAGGPAAEMIDLVFAVTGTAVPQDYHQALAQALGQALPWLAKEAQSGALGLRVAASTTGPLALLPQRARLTLRVPLSRVDAAAQLCGQVLELDGHAVTVGQMHARPLQPANTLYAEFVCLGNQTLNDFEASAAEALRGLGFEAHMVCGGQRVRQAGDTRLLGHALALHELKPTQSWQVQHLGLGSHRAIGCGFFVPHKTIRGLE